MISAWCREQLSVWTARKPSHRDAEAEFRHVNAANPFIRLFEFRDGDVSIVPKSVKDAEELNNLVDGDLRLKVYRKFFQDVVRERQPKFEGFVAMFLEDGFHESETAPFFAFQKNRGVNCVLINDIDTLIANFYENIARDQINYTDKKSTGIFAGSTTGGQHTVASIEALENQRIRSALYFRDSPLVEFLLPNIVQCSEPEAEQLLRDMGFGGRGVSWSEQLVHKFILSMDGNGATCSRVALALRSNSVLVKYKSDSLLYYFSGLQPWKHFIPALQDRDVIDIIQAEINSDNFFAEVASEGRRFYDEFLSREANIDYAATLLEKYYESFDRPYLSKVTASEGGSGLDDHEVRAFGIAHVAGIGDVEAVAGEFGLRRSGRAIEGVRIFNPVHEGREARLEVAVTAAGLSQEWVQAGDFAGTFGQSRPLTGIELRPAEQNQTDFVFRIAAGFIDGTKIDTQFNSSNSLVSSVPLEYFVIYLKFLNDIGATI